MISPGEYVQLRIFLPDDQAPLQVPLAAVRWVAGVRAGLEFIRTPESEQRRLDDFVRMRLYRRRKSTWSAGMFVPEARGL
jgi:hypothetical protein